MDLRDDVAHTEGPMIIESARSRIFYKSLDAAFTASLRPPTGVAAQLGSLISPCASNYDRVGMLVGLLDRAIPGTQRRLSRALHRPASLPFRVRNVQLLGYGSGATVFLLDGDGWQRVLKVYRRTIGRNGKNLSQLATTYRAKLNTVRRWYGNLVLPAEYLILHGPILGVPAVAALQEFLPDIGQDVFACHGHGDLLPLLRKDNGLRADFSHFARRTLEAVEQERACPDILGEGNVLVLGRGDGHVLRMIDYGGFDMEVLQRRCMPTLHALEQRLGTLRSILEEFEVA
jgi:hypothetical protein